MSRPIKTVVLVAVLALLGLAGYAAAGPFLAYQAIRDAVRAGDTAELSRHVDFPALRASLRAQVEDHLARRAGPEMQSSVLGGLLLRAASGVAAGTIDTMVTPAGVGAVLQGRSVWNRISSPADGTDVLAPPPAADPMAAPRYRFESPSRFTATLDQGGPRPLVVVLTRDGLRWTLSDIRLPLAAED